MPGRRPGSGVEVGLQYPCGPAREGSDAEAAGVREGVEHRLAFGVVEQPAAQLAGVEVEAGVLVEQRVDGVAHAMLADLRVGATAARRPERDPPAARLVEALALLDDDRGQPRQPRAQGVEDRGQPGVVGLPAAVDDGRAPVGVDHPARVALEVAVEQPEGGPVRGVDEGRAGGQGRVEVAERLRAGHGAIIASERRRSLKRPARGRGRSARPGS